jgi:hypothetical protein
MFTRGYTPDPQRGGEHHLLEITNFTGVKPGVSEWLILCSKCAKTHLRASGVQKKFLGSLSLAITRGEKWGTEGKGGERRGWEGRGDGDDGTGGEGRGGEGKDPPALQARRRPCALASNCNRILMDQFIRALVYGPTYAQ